jgi:hypothetical protein
MLLSYVDILIHLIGAVLQPGLISQANGSAYIETERTKIACAVFVCPVYYSNLHVPNAGKDTDLDKPKMQHIVKMAGLMLKSSMPPFLVNEGKHLCA